MVKRDGNNRNCHVFRSFLHVSELKVRIALAFSLITFLYSLAMNTIRRRSPNRCFLFFYRFGHIDRIDVSSKEEEQFCKVKAGLGNTVVTQAEHTLGGDIRLQAY